MEGYFVSAIDLMDIPRNVELSDLLRSSNGWSQFGIGGGRQTFRRHEKNSMMDSSSASEEFCQGSTGGAEGLSSFHGLSSQSLWQNAVPSDYMDFQLDNLEGVGQEDGLYANSYLEDIPGNEKLHGSFCVCPDCWYDVSQAGHSWLNPSDLQSIASKKHGMESSNCCESHCFSPSLGWEKEITAPQSVPCNTEQEMISEPEAQQVNIPVPFQHCETPLEESVLLDLKMVMTQMTDKTRICFRDALYRLAHSTKQHHVAMEDESIELDEEKPPPWTEQNMRSEKKTMESETNVIDRAVANIMFNRMDYNNGDFSAKSPDGLAHEILREADTFQHHSLRTSMLSNDHEVPIFPQSNRTERNKQSA